MWPCGPSTPWLRNSPLLAVPSVLHVCGWVLAIDLRAGPHHCQPSASCSTHLSRLNGGSSPLPALCFLYYTSLLHHLLHLQHHLRTKHLAESLETSVVLAEEQTSFPALMRVLCGSYLIFLQSPFGLRPESWILWALPYYIVNKGQRRCETHIVDQLQFNSPHGHWKGTYHIAMSHAGYFAWPRQVVMFQPWLFQVRADWARQRSWPVWEEFDTTVLILPGYKYDYDVVLDI